MLFHRHGGRAPLLTYRSPSFLPSARRLHPPSSFLAPAWSPWTAFIFSSNSVEVVPSLLFSYTGVEATSCLHLLLHRCGGRTLPPLLLYRREGPAFFSTDPITPDPSLVRWARGSMRQVPHSLVHGGAVGVVLRNLGTSTLVMGNGEEKWK